MNAGRRLLMGLCVIGAVSCASCIPCDHPLADETTSVADELLIGDWVASSSDGDPPLHVSIHRKRDLPNVLECFETGVAPDPEDDTDVIDLFTAKVHNLRLITYREAEANEQPPTYSIWLIDPDDEDHLKIYAMDERAIAKAILARELSGEIRRGWFFGWYAKVLRITGEPAELRKFLAHAGRTCFDRSAPAWTLTRASVPH